ncbi:MAG: hypothetical protein K6E28_08375 [Eubacterium sp.]|nr:hypothetical protein [Eubacterium sp.]
MALEKNRKDVFLDKFTLYDADDAKHFNLYMFGLVLAIVGLVITIAALFFPVMRYMSETTISSGNKSYIDTPVSFFRGSYISFLVIVAVAVSGFLVIKKKVMPFFISAFALTLISILTMILSKYYVSKQLTQSVVGSGFETIGKDAKFGTGFFIMVAALVIVIVSAFMQKAGEARIKRYQEEKINKKKEELARKREEMKKAKESSVVFIKK